ncbi:hypothetical protein GCM10025867_51070 (plasmid) [Frondihabitans sucicola]|uniref:Uncharacterized protein n=1 Tax=Frondihabitans sucicola TaxID=1268041 RepID=A0ABN6Y760_9MICO|nr:hypothetical protein [Frondihabitans sucicola]BDZ52300.1 hypothetical protein GCM10025867_45410 [Frondihabitans sucicola]BDZ52866.1 hypothetical protein GCM10025867_51070 [Frondihabitans sucicola]
MTITAIRPIVSNKLAETIETFSGDSAARFAAETLATEAGFYFHIQTSHDLSRAVIGYREGVSNVEVLVDDAAEMETYINGNMVYAVGLSERAAELVGFVFANVATFALAAGFASQVEADVLESIAA